MTCVLGVCRSAALLRIAAVIVSILLVSAPLAAQSGAVSFTEYSIPTSNSYPIGIVSGPDGALWFAERAKVGKITSNGTITEYTDAGGGLYLTVGPDGALWFTGDGKVKRITTAGEVSQFTMPSSSSDPNGITIGPDGALWFTENNSSRIGRMTTSGVVTEYPLLGSSSPGSIVPGPDGALWFTEGGSNRIGRITTSGTITEYPIPTQYSLPAGITVGMDGALWFTETNGNKVGRITVSGGFTEYPLPSYAPPGKMKTDSDGSLWIAGRDRIFKMKTPGVFAEYPVPNLNPSSGGQIADITAASGGFVWFTDSNGRIGRMDTVGGVSGAALLHSFSKEAAGVSSISLPMGETIAGNTILIFVRMSTTTQTVSISDTRGNSYAEAVSQVQDQEEHQIHIFYAANIAGGLTTVRADFSDINDHPWLAAFEYSGLRSTDPLDQIAHAQSFGANDSSGMTAPTTQPYELLFAGTGQESTYYDPVKAGPGYVIYQSDPGPSRAAVEAIAVNSAGAYAATFTTNDVHTWSAVLATFVATGPVPVPSITTSSMPDGSQNGTSYFAAVSASGGRIPYTWSVVSGSLPPGIGFNAQAGVLNGYPS
ncbi:MAG TPA: hypothetical protein VK210_04135, partial [Terriglobia bacterium]|nr:hypothetical protein [Terriglobia bacterium]